MLVGLTGPAGCGKSTALEIFSSLGWLTLDADALCHEIYSEREGSFVKSLAARWGAKVFDSAGRVDRRSIASIVFGDASELAWLDAALHPEIRRRALEKYEKSGSGPTIFDVPLLFEAAWRGLFKTVVAVWCEPSLQLARLRARGWDAQAIERRLASQMNPDLKLELADFGLINNSSKGFLRRQCETVSKRLLDA